MAGRARDPLIRVRAALPADADAIAAIYAPYVTASAVSFELDPPSGAAMRERIVAGNGLYPWLVGVTEDDAILGYAAAARFRERAAYRFAVETSVYVAADAHGRGVGGLLYRALIAMLRAQRFTQAIAAIVPPNEASIALHESLGYRRAGTYRSVGYKFDRWHDVELWQLGLAEPADPPIEPKPLGEVGADHPR